MFCLNIQYEFKFLKASATYFTWSILENIVPNVKSVKYWKALKEL